ncbi:MAG: hypothetical protein DMG57_20510 [Acidobacteria bacterium]|nr:MAG: hypothetical protein DMG57_20510 [Acidobacteriota bacterium]
MFVVLRTKLAGLLRTALTLCPLVLIVLTLASCARYAEFTLPVLPQSGATRFEWMPREMPVLQPGAPGDWDSHDALNPSVVHRENLYFNLYSGFDGKTWHTGLATSEDGLTWQKQGRVLSPDPKTWEGDYIAANGSAMFAQGEFFYWYQTGARDGPSIALARSTDGRTWSKERSAVISPGPRGSSDERGVGDPDVIRLDDGWFYMYYLGQDRAWRQRIGLARSRDGIQWEKLRSSPVLDLGEAGALDEEGLGEPAVWAAQGSYWMLYTGRDRAENRRLGLGQSRDGVNWKRMPLVISGNAAWDSKVVCDPSVEVQRDAVRVWFGGGDVARPDENLHGQIGVGTLRLLAVPTGDGTLAK